MDLAKTAISVSSQQLFQDNATDCVKEFNAERIKSWPQMVVRDALTVSESIDLLEPLASKFPSVPEDRSETVMVIVRRAQITHWSLQIKLVVNLWPVLETWEWLLMANVLLVKTACLFHKIERSASQENALAGQSWKLMEDVQSALITLWLWLAEASVVEDAENPCAHPTKLSWLMVTVLNVQAILEFQLMAEAVRHYHNALEINTEVWMETVSSVPNTKDSTKWALVANK
jgi:hypothetical protein